MDSGPSREDIQLTLTENDISLLNFAGADSISLEMRRSGLFAGAAQIRSRRFGTTL